MILRCNHTIIYEGQEQRQGPLLQLLKVTGMSSIYNMFTLTLDFHITSSLLIPGTRTTNDDEAAMKQTRLTPTTLCLQRVTETRALRVSL